jgi:hypothetical protein
LITGYTAVAALWLHNRPHHFGSVGTVLAVAN